jgi:hypothetical protein
MHSTGRSTISNTALALVNLSGCVNSQKPPVEILLLHAPGEMTTQGSSRTRQYIRNFDKIAESSKTSRELYDQMLKLYPDGSNPHILWLGAAKCEGTVLDSVRFRNSKL